MPSVSFTLNGKTTRLDVAADRPLLWVLRDDLGLTGTKFGCGEGHCASCTVLVDNEATRSCVTTIGDVAGKKVTTIEGLASGARLHAIQQAFVDHAAYQCGYCTPGMILGAYAFLLKHPRATRAEVVKAMDPHLCRCGAHVRILQAIETAGAAMRRAPIEVGRERAQRSELRERSEPAERLARERVGESEGRRPSVKGGGAR